MRTKTGNAILTHVSGDQRTAVHKRAAKQGERVIAISRVVVTGSHTSITYSARTATGQLVTRRTRMGFGS
jgi:hypothetical protein